LGNITKQKRFTSIMRMIFSTADEDITCDECYDQIDQYVDLLRAGQNPGEVLPRVKNHLEQCRCCEAEFNALITILEGQSTSEGET
jgi:deoxycytidylate deaminase